MELDRVKKQAEERHTVLAKGEPAEPARSDREAERNEKKGARLTMLAGRQGR